MLSGCALRLERISLSVVIAVVTLALPLPLWAQAKSGGGRPMRDKALKSETDRINKDLDRAEKNLELFTKDNDIKSFGKVRDALFKLKDDINAFGKLAGKDNPDAQALVKRYLALKDAAYVGCEEILAKAVANVQPPTEVYDGQDKEKLREMIAAAWKKTYPKDEILSIRLSSSKWEKTKIRRWNDAANEWQYTDKDALAASVIVKTTEKIATLFPAYINRDNLEGGDLNVGVETKSSEYVIKELLVSNVK